MSDRGYPEAVANEFSTPHSVHGPRRTHHRGPSLREHRRGVRGARRDVRRLRSRRPGTGDPAGRRKAHPRVAGRDPRRRLPQRDRVVRRRDRRPCDAGARRRGLRAGDLRPSGVPARRYRHTPDPRAARLRAGRGHSEGVAHRRALEPCGRLAVQEDRFRDLQRRELRTGDGAPAEPDGTGTETETQVETETRTRTTSSVGGDRLQRHRGWSGSFRRTV